MSADTKEMPLRQGTTMSSTFGDEAIHEVDPSTVGAPLAHARSHVLSVRPPQQRANWRIGT